MNINEIRKKANMTQKEFGEYLNIPVRTLQAWEGEKRTPPEYLVELIEYKIKKEMLEMLKLIVKDHGEEEIIKEGTLIEIVEYLKENEELTNWVLDEDPDVELPVLDEIENIDDLEYELDKIDLSWWSLEIEVLKDEI